MAKVTKVEAQKKPGRYNVYLDGEYAFSLTEKVIARFRILKGTTVDENLKAQLLAEDGVAQAYAKALNYLSYQMRTIKEVYTKLQSCKFDEQTITTVMEELQQQNLLNDQQYADSFVRDQSELYKKGPAVIRQKLVAKGISVDKITEALAQFQPDQVKTNGLVIGQKLVSHYQHESAKNKIQKVRQQLFAKGFTTNQIQPIIEQLDFEDEDNEIENLRREAEKVWHRNRKLTEAKRVLKTKQTLYSKGYKWDAIEQAIAELTRNGC